MHVEIVLPPRVGCTLEVVSGIADFVTNRNMSYLKFPLNAAKPVIGGKGLSGEAEDRGTKVNEVIQRHHLITLLGGVTCDDLQQCTRISVVPLDLHQDLGHGGRWWKIVFLLLIPTSMGTAKMSTSSLRHPEDKIKVKQS